MNSEQLDGEVFVLCLLEPKTCMLTFINRALWYSR